MGRPMLKVTRRRSCPLRRDKVRGGPASQCCPHTSCWPLWGEMHNRRPQSNPTQSKLGKQGSQATGLQVKSQQPWRRPSAEG